MRNFYLQGTLVLAILCAFGFISRAQDFSNKGKEFWLCFPQHVPSGNNLATLSIWITSDKASSGTITMTNGAFSSTFNIPANGLQEIQIPHSIGHISNGESGLVIQKSIKIKCDVGKPAVVAYAQQWGAARSAATLLLPTNVLGKKYYATSYTQNGTNSGTYLGRSQFQIIATKPNTVVKITPRNNGSLGTPFNVALPLTGDMYQYQSTLDLTGTLIESVASGSGGCLPIAVFSGSSTLTFGIVSCTGGNQSYDPLFQQQYPVSTWGKNFGFIPFGDYPNGNPYRVLASENNTNVYFNGSMVATLNEGEIYPNTFNTTPVVLTSPTSISADKPIAVIQYAQRLACGGGGFGDPDMVLLNPIEQNIKDITIFSSSQQAITRQWINILIQSSAAASFRINGNPPSVPFQNFASLPGYFYLQQLLTGPGSYRLSADSGFNAIAYGFGNNFESYAYSAGTNVKDLYQQIGVQTEFGIEPTPSVCVGSPFKFKVSLPYCADSIYWDLSLLPGPPAPPATILYSSCTPGPGGPDSTTVVNGKTIYWYSLPTTYNFATAGTFPVTITTYTPNTDGCGSEQNIDFELNVYDPPVADFIHTTPGCSADTVRFTDVTTTPRPSYIWRWEFGDPASGTANLSGIQNPTHVFSAPGTYTVKFSTITTPGCVSAEITKTIIVPDMPSATITTSTNSACINANPGPLVTFTGSGGAPPYTFTYNINGGPNQTISTTGTNTSVTLNVPTSTNGNFRYNLVDVKNTGSSLCVQNISGAFVDIVISANTTLTLTSASSSANQVVCESTPITNIVYSIGGSGTGATVTGLPAGVTGNFNAGVFTISGIPTSVGVFNYTITTTGSCLPGTATGTITVNPGSAISLSSAAGTNAQELCRNSNLANITYNLTGGATGASVTGLPAGVSGLLSGGVFTISGTPTTAGTFNYTVTATGSCGQIAATGSILVNALPTADFNFSSIACENKLVSFADISNPNAGSINTWNWNFGDASSSTLQNPSHAYAAAGSYTVTLSVTTDKGCVSNPIASKQVNVSINPKAGFIVPEVCINDVAAVFTDTSSITSGSITGWSWNFGDPPSGPLNTSTAQTGSHLYTATGSYNVTQIVYSSTGCSDTVQHAIFINGANPVTDFSILSPSALCANDSIAISNQSTVNPGNVTRVEIYWDNAGAPTVFELDDLPSFGKVYKHLYPNFQSPLTRSFDIRFRAYSGTLCVSDRIKTITVHAAPLVQFTNIPDACFDAAPFQITQASETGGVPGTGVFSGPGVSSGGQFNPATVGPGTYTIKYSFTSSAGGCVDSMSRTITVLDTASARFSFSSQLCDRTPVVFTSVSSSIPAGAGTITGWNWNFGDPASGAANISTLQNPTHLFTSWGTYNVTLSVTTSNGCRSTVRTVPVYVNPIPRANFNFPASACLPSATINFTNTSSIADGTQSSFTYLWNFGDPASGALNTSTGSNPSHIYNSAGPFNVNLQVTSGTGCVKDTTIIVNNIHPEPTGSFTVDKNDICVGETFTFTDNSNPADGTTVQWNWNMGNGDTRNTSTFTYAYPAAGVFNVTLFITNSHGCRSSTATRTVTVNAFPQVNAGPDLFILEGGSDTLRPIITATNPTFLWTPNTYFVSSNTIQDAVVQGVADITYTLTVTGRGGCTASDQVSVKVLKGPEIPNIFSPNGDGIHDTWVIKYLNTYPGGTVEIFNRYGQRIFHSVGYGTPWDGTVNGKPVPMGTYYYIVDPKNGRKTMSGYVDIIR